MGILDRWRHCPLCAGALRHVDGRAECERCGHVHYANPIPGAQAVVERDGRILLGRRALDPGRGLWDLPGGFLEEEEHPEAALHREVREETGLEIETTDWLGSWMQPYDGRTVLCLTWLATPIGGNERAGDDLVELHWFARDELPGPDELAFEHYVDVLAVWLRRQEDA